MFTQDKNDDFDWTRHSAATRDTKYTPNTGPSADHTGSKQGKCFYTKAGFTFSEKRNTISKNMFKNLVAIIAIISSHPVVISIKSKKYSYINLLLQ